MTRTFTFLAAIVSTLLIAGQASAVLIFLNPPSATSISVGQTFTIELRLDTEGETDLTSLFVSASVDPAVLSFVSGTSPGSILFNFSTFQGISRVSQPFINGGDPAGAVRAASFSATGTSGTGISNANQLLSTLTFSAVGAGTSSIMLSLQTGDDVTVSGVSIQGGALTLGANESVTVPEPGVLAASLAALGTVVAVRRRRA